MADVNTWNNLDYKNGLQTDLNTQLSNYQDMLRRNTDPNAVFYIGGNNVTRSQLEAKVNSLQNALSDNMRAQGATDENGVLTKAKDVQDQYLNKDYINFMGNQMEDSTNTALNLGMKAMKQRELKGQSPMIGEVMNQADAIKRQQAGQMGQIVKGEQDVAYNKAGQDLSNAKQYATQLTNDQRQQAENQLNMFIQQNARDMNLSAQQIQLLQNRIANTPDGLLVDLAKAAASGAGSLIGSWVTGGWGGAVAGAGSLGSFVTQGINALTGNNQSAMARTTMAGGGSVGNLGSGS